MFSLFSFDTSDEVRPIYQMAQDMKPRRTQVMPRLTDLYPTLPLMPVRKKKLSRAARKRSELIVLRKWVDRGFSRVKVILTWAELLLLSKINIRTYMYMIVYLCPTTGVNL